MFTLDASTEPLCQIVIPAQPTPVEEHAASVLQTYLQRACGLGLSVVRDTAAAAPHELVIGRCARLDGLGVEASLPDLGTDGFHIKTVDGHLIIVGGSEKGET